MATDACENGVVFIGSVFCCFFVVAVVAVNTIVDGSATKIDPAWCEHSLLWFIKGYKVISQGLMFVFLHPFYCFIIIFLHVSTINFCQCYALINVNQEGWGGEGDKGWGFDKGRSPIVGTYNYRQVLGVRTFEVPLITDDILDWKL